MHELLKIDREPSVRNGLVRSVQEEQILDPRQVWVPLWKRKWLILAIAAIVLAPAIVMLYLAVPQYLSTVTIKIEASSIRVMPYADITQANLTATYNYELYIKTQDQVLRSQTLANRTIGRLRELGYGETIDKLGGIRERLDIQRLENTEVLAISFEAPDPEFAALAVNTFAAEYLKSHLEAKYEDVEKAQRFLRDQLDSLRSRLEAAELEAIEYARKHNMLDIGAGDQTVTEAKFDFLNTQLTQAESRYFSKRAHYLSIQNATVDDFPDGLKTPSIASLEGRLFALDQELTRLLAQFDENWPEVRQKRQEIGRVQEQLTEEKQATIRSALTQAKLDYTTAREEYRMLSQALEQQQVLLDKFNQDSIQLSILQREVDTNRELYQGLLQRLKETGVTQGLELGNIHVLDPARPSYFPYKPQWVRDIAIALLLGLGLGVAVAFLLDYFDRSVKTPDDAERMGFPVLGVIPIIAGLNGGGGRLKPAPQRLLSAGQFGKDGKAAKVATRPVWLVKESYRRVCASIMLARGGSPAESILITSSLPREGKTTTVAHLGVALAEIGARTVMIDADFRRSTLSQEFGMKGDKGQLSLHLAGQVEFDPACIRDTEVPNLHLIPSGPRAPNPVALLSSKELGELLELLRGSFQYILIDSPPLLSVADARVLAPKVDGVVLVIEANKTPREAVRRAYEELRRSESCLLGTLINRANLGGADYSEYRSYYGNYDYEDDSRISS